MKLSKRLQEQERYSTNKLIFEKRDSPGTIFINWPLIPCMKHYPPEDLYSAQITSRASNHYQIVRHEVPAEVRELIENKNCLRYEPGK